MNPFFSVVMAVHNAEKYLPETMDSLLKQSFSDFEVLVVDDNSQDGTLSYLKSIVDPRIRVLSSPSKGQTAALNYGIRQARAAWIARMDGDDVCLPERLAQQASAIRQATRPPVLVTSDYWICDHTLNPVAIVRLAQPGKRLRQYLASRNNPICHPTVAFHRDTALAIGGYDESLRNAQDIRLWHALINRGDWIHVSQPLLKYRVLPGSLSIRFQPEQESERTAVLSGKANTVPRPFAEASTAEIQSLYHYKLGFAAWLAGQRQDAWREFLKVCNTWTPYTKKALVCLALSILPRRIYLFLAGYRGVYA